MFRHHLLLALPMFFSAHQVYAQAPGENLFELGVTQYAEKYEEFTKTGGKVMQETANMTGIQAKWTRVLDARSEFSLGASYASGQGSYIGAYQGGKYGDVAISGLGRSLWDVSGAYRLSPEAWNGFSLKAGLGYRKHTDNLQDAGPAGYQRINSRLYATFGMAQKIRTEHWSVTPYAEYRPVLWSQHYSDFAGGLNMAQAGHGAELGVSITTASAYGLTITPFYRTWDMKDSSIVSGYYEPRNTTKEVGLTAGWSF